MNKNLTILGAGKLGVTLAQLAIKAGYSVYIAGSGSPDKIALSVKVIAPGAIALNTSAAIAKSDVVILALPLSKHRNLPTEDLANKLVIDSMNYWWEIDGHDKALSDPKTSTSQIVQDFLPKSRVVKALSHMGYHHLHDEAKTAGSKERKSIAVAGDNPSDRARVAEIVNELGFDPVMIKSLAEGKLLEPGHPSFGANVDAKTLQSYLSQKPTTAN